MSHKLVNLNKDLRRLRDDGYNIDIHAAHLVVRDVPYVNEKGEVRHDGILITDLELSGDITNQPQDHQIRFAGECPCTKDGQRLEALRLSANELRLSDKLTSQWHFSRKPPSGRYADYHEKIRTYAAILSQHAVDIDPYATPRTKRLVEPSDEESPFHYLDTASARAEINIITAKLAVEKLAIVGLGGTGSYVLDLLAKTPAKEIHLFDGDTFASHNAFRAPGAASKDQLRKQPLKVAYFKEIYSRMHRGIVAHDEYVDNTNIDQLREMACVFLCIDAGPGKKYIVEKLEEFGITFIDTGIGLYVKDETLGGILRVTTSEARNRVSPRASMSFAGDEDDNEYDKNIQVADLNALNAIFAVMRWKKLRGFYFDLKRERLTSYTIGTNMLLSDDIHESG